MKAIPLVDLSLQHAVVADEVLDGFRDVLEAVRPAGSVRHVALLTGLKHYLGPFEAYGEGDGVRGGAGRVLLHEPQRLLGGGEHGGRVRGPYGHALRLPPAAEPPSQQLLFRLGQFDGGRHAVSPSMEVLSACRNSEASRPLMSRWS